MCDHYPVHINGKKPVCPCGEPGSVSHLYDGCTGLPHFKPISNQLRMLRLNILDLVNPKLDNFLIMAKNLAIAIQKSNVEGWF